MPSILTLLLVSGWLSPTPARHQTKHHLAVDMELRVRGHELFDLSPSATIELDQASVFFEPLDDIVFTTSDWIGVELNDDLAVLLDLRLSSHATSPDPARPDLRGAFAASIGVGMRTD
jgi:hypothetical protein